MIVVAVVVDRAKLPGAFTAISFVKPNTYLTCDGTVSPWRRAKETALAQKGRYRWASGFTSLLRLLANGNNEGSSPVSRRCFPVYTLRTAARSV